MRQKILSTTICALTALALGDFFEMLDGMEPSVHPLPAVVTHLLHIAIAGAIVLGSASVVSTFSLRFGIGLGLAGCLLSWPYWGIRLIGFPWKDVIRLLSSVVGRPELAALFMLLISSAYMVAQFWLLRSRDSKGTA